MTGTGSNPANASQGSEDRRKIIRDEQIDALFSRRAVYYVMRELCVHQVQAADYQRVFRVRRGDILEWVAEDPARLETYGRYHGLSILTREPGVWILRDEGYDGKFGWSPTETRFPSLEQARQRLLEYLLRHTYTGIDFSTSAAATGNQSPNQ